MTSDQNQQLKKKINQDEKDRSEPITYIHTYIHTKFVYWHYLATRKRKKEKKKRKFTNDHWKKKLNAHFADVINLPWTLHLIWFDLMWEMI